MTFEEQLNKTGTLTYTNKGFSMMPLLRENRDIMVIEKVDGAQCQKYDAVLFVRPRVSGRGHYVLHRILRKNADGSYWIIGDNCLSGETVRPEEILGKLTAVIRDGKKINVTDRGYLLYVHLWCDFLPIRFFLIRCKSFFRRGLGWVKRRILRR